MKITLTDNNDGTFKAHFTNIGGISPTSGGPVPSIVTVDLTLTPAVDCTPTADQKDKIHQISA